MMKCRKAQIACQESVLIWIENVLGLFILYDPMATVFKSKVI